MYIHVHVCIYWCLPPSFTEHASFQIVITETLVWVCKICVWVRDDSHSQTDHRFSKVLRNLQEVSEWFQARWLINVNITYLSKNLGIVEVCDLFHYTSKFRMNCKKKFSGYAYGLYDGSCTFGWVARLSSNLRSGVVKLWQCTHAENSGSNKH